MKKIIVNILIIALFVNNAMAQSKGFVIPDSLKNKSFVELRNAFFNNYKDIKKATIYGNAYLQKGKDIHNTDTIAEAYHMLAYLIEKQKTTYFDSIISLKYTKVNKIYPATAYLEKGVVLADYNTKKALENYLKGLQEAKKSKNIFLENDFIFNIGFLKTLIGENKEALNLFKKNYAFNIKHNYSIKYNYDYLITVFGLADSYHRNHILDSATYYNKLGLIAALNHKNNRLIALFILNEGANNYEKRNYKATIDSIQKAIPLIKKDDYNLGIAHFYLGSAFYKIDKKKKGIQHLLKMDSLISLTNYIMPEEREGYQTLISYYKNNKKLTKQLFFTEKLIKSDSLLKSYHQNLSKDLALKFDIPKLVEDKNNLINQLNKKSNKQYYFIVVLILLFGIALYFVYTNYKSKKAFERIITQLEKSKEGIIKPDKETLILNTKIDLPETTITHILNQLELFENNMGYLEIGITQNEMAKKIQTNSSYLSKVVNHYKQQNFSSYLNDLRINYAIKTLKEDNKVRKYTIKAIANEFGFNNTESFSKAFYKKTKIYPSYFIKQLEKNKITNT